MNFVAHAHVTLRRTESSWEEAFGAALPDLLAMAATRVDRSLVGRAVEDGVALHHRTDEAFHGLEAFHTGCGQIREGLLEAGLPKGAARAIGHAGHELLLDGCLLTRPGVQEEFTEVLARAPDVTEAVPTGDRGSWRQLLAVMRDERRWLGYSDPQMVARLLYRRLQARRLLRFSELDLPVVAAVLRAARPSIDAVTDDIIGAVTDAIR
jgi:hypothetical protein